LNYRQDGGTPSIQVSTAKDGRHADIDVDYRSSKFPDALFNGHLTAANSDVRAGGNTQKHLQRWDGLSDWWHDLFGLADSKVETADAVVAPGEVPPIPSKGGDKLDEAIADFLTSWLVEQKPELAAAYLSPRSFSCLEEYGPQAGNQINAGVAPYLAARDMAATNQRMGKPVSLQAAIQPAPLSDPGARPVKQKYGDVFALYQMTAVLAADFECDPEQAFKDYENSTTSEPKAKTGRYFGSVFKLKPKQGKGDTVTMVWTREGKYWKVIAWDVEPDGSKPDAVPDTRRRATTATVAPSQMQGDAALLQGSDQFLHAWLLKDDFNTAAAYFSPSSNACINAYLQTGEKEPKTPDEQSAYLNKALRAVGKDVAPARHLRDAIEPISLDHAGLKLVAHKDDDAYTVVAVPDSLVDSFSCQARSAEHPYLATSDGSSTESYGKYYATLFALRTPGDHPAALSFLWNKEGGRWKIVAYQLVAP
jgi:hypothetical protein